MMYMNRLDPWWHWMEPHQDIQKNKRLDESIFAADLGQVVRGDATEEYQEPVRFFEGTFLSEGLLLLLRDVVEELAGKGKGNRIIQIETPFGGGKTHALLALYHLIQHREKLRNRLEIRRVLRETNERDIPEARVAAVVGSDTSAVEATVQADGTVIQTLWGQIAYQLGGAEGYARMREADMLRAAPGADALRDLFASVPPRLILMDELVNYVVAAAAVNIGDSTLKDQTIVFLQQLTQAVAQTPRTMLLLTIPGSKTEFYGQAAKEMQQQVFDVGRQIGDVVGRVQTVRTPVQGDDIYEVLRRRLFKPLDGHDAYKRRDEAAYGVATAYVGMYRQLGNDVPQEMREEGYIERMARSYPFHPDVVRILYERWGTIPNFQRTRGALRILGMVLAHLFPKRQPDPLILPCHIQLGAGDLRNELVRVLGDENLNNVLDSDVVGKAAQIDMRLGEANQKFCPAVRTATTIFMWSFSGSMNETLGANEGQIRVGVLHPEMESAMVHSVLGEFRKKLWYLHEESNVYRFEKQANLNRVIVMKEDGITTERAKRLIEQEIWSEVERGKRMLTGMRKSDSIAPMDAKVYCFPKSSQEVADVASMSIVVMDPSQHTLAGESIDNLSPIIHEILHQYGERPRENRNMVMILIADSRFVAQAEKSARRLLALEEMKGDSQLNLRETQLADLEAMLKTAKGSFPQEATRIYQSVVIPAGREQGGMQRLNIGLQTGVKGMIWDEAFQLMERKWHYLDRIEAGLLEGNHFGIWPKDAQYVSTQRVWDSFVQFPHLPMLAGKHVLIESIRRGCEEGVLGYARGDEQGPLSADQAWYGKQNPNLTVEIAPTTWILKAAYAKTSIALGHELVREIPTELLTDPSIWPSGTERRRLSDIWAAVERHYSPRPVAGIQVLNAAIHSAIAEKKLRISVDGSTPSYDAEQLGPERVAQLVGIDLVRPATKPNQRPRLLTIDVKNVALGQLSKITTGAIVPLQQQGATITLRLVIDAANEDGIDLTLLELTVKETLKQLGLAADYTQSA